MCSNLLGALSIGFALFLVLMVLSLVAVVLIKAYNWVSEKAMPKPKSDTKTTPPATASGTGTSRPILRVTMTDKPSNVMPLRAVEKQDDSGIERSLWVCLCGCFSFRLFDDGHIQCAKCGRWSDEARAVFSET